MVEQNRIDLIDEFSNVQKNNDYVVLGTFNFDPYFFDSFLFKKLESNNPSAQIIVLIDAGQYAEAYPRFTKITGRKYHLCPISLRKGVFHPKIFLFHSDQDRRATLYIGSSNLTLPGFANNAELVTKLEYNLQNSSPGRNLLTVIEMFQRFVNTGLVSDESVSMIIDELHAKIVGKHNPDIGEEHNIRIYHNLDHSIYEQLERNLSGKEFDELFVYAPFLSPNANLLNRLLGVVNPKEFTLLLQLNNHNLADVSVYESVCKSYSVVFEVKEAIFSESDNRKRKMHSKFVHFAGKNDDVFLAGSPNFTESALLENATGGNFEVAVLYDGTDVTQILAEVETIAISDIKQFLSHKMEGIAPPESSNFLAILSVRYERLDHNLHVITNKEQRRVTAIVYTESPLAIIEVPQDLATGHFKIAIPEGIPTEIILTENCNILARRRIFYDKDEMIKKLGKAIVPMSEIIKTIHGDFNVGASEVIQLIGGIFRGANAQAISANISGGNSHNEEKKDEREKFATPAKQKGIGGFNELLRKLSDYYEVMTQNQKITAEATEKGEDVDKGLGQHYRSTKQFDEAKVARTIERILMKLDDILFQYYEVEDSDNPSDTITNAQVLLIIIYIKLFRRLSLDRTIFEALKSLISENMQIIHYSDVVPETRRIFFQYLLCLTLPLSDTTYFKFMREMFVFEDIITKEMYFETKKLVKEFLGSIPASTTDWEVNQDLFADRYGHLVSYCMTPNNVIDCVNELCDSITAESDGEYRRMLIKALQNSYRFSLNEGLKTRIRNIGINI